MAEYRVPTQAEINRLLYMQGLQGKTQQQIIDENLVRGIAPIPENVFQRIAGGARAAGEFVNRAGSAADVAKLFPGYKPETKVTIPTGYSFAPKQAPTGEVIPGGLQTQSVNLGQVLGAIKPADVLGISGAERAYTDIGLGKAPQPLDVLDVAGLGATGLIGGKAALQATRGLPVGMSIQEAKGLLQTAPKSDIGFYSAVEQAAMASPRKSGAGQAFLNDIMKGQDVRADEIKWMGLDEFLKGKQNITKQEVQDYITNNRVDVQEVQLGAGTVKPFEQWAADQGLTPEAVRAFEPSLRNSYEAFRNNASQKVGAAKFGSYTLPGGENYRELLLTMPSNRPSLKNMSRAEYNAAIEAADKAGVQDYISSHFPDQPNILAHLRVNDRVDADGKKMLLIEEVQSDWHQAGREKGYAKNVKNELDAIQKQMNELANQRDPVTNRMVNEDQWFELARKKDELIKQSQGVPDAPFKDTWYQLALKRAIQHAAENGYDRIGLTTGSQQAARFDLSKQLNSVSYRDGVLKGYDKNNELVINQSVQPKDLSNYVGKDLASKMAENSAKTTEIEKKLSAAIYNKAPQSEIVALRSELSKFEPYYSGLDLQVGGEGMKKYYDEIYPKFLDKYGKKWGAKVAEGKLQGTVSKDELAAKVYGMGETYKNLPSELKRKIDQMYMGSGETIRYLDITPEMKAGVSKGQPLFQAAPIIGTGLLGQQEER